MPYIKKLVLKGFKSFPRETEVPFDNSMNVIIGPNGSGKSNIADAICFVLGRLSIKSIRAAKSANLIFAGTKEHKPSSEASVKIIFNNSDRKFSLQENEVEVERIVRSSGQSIYKINQEVKTRQEVLELLAQTGIDPYGFNIVLQGEIDSIVKMHPEERRKVIEEVAGISIYELRKEKSLRELEKTEEKLKETQSILRERTSYLRNLEEERKQALKFKKLQENEKKFKASILKKKLDEKLKELSNLTKQQEEKDKSKQQIRGKEEKIQGNLNELQQEIEKINSSIQKSSGIEQNELQNLISDIRAELAGLDVRKENNETKLQELLSRRQKTEQEIKNSQQEIEKLRKEFPSQASKYKDLEKKKSELAEAEKSRKQYYNLKEKLNSTKELFNDREKQLISNTNESSFLLKEIDKISEELTYKNIETCKKDIIKSKEEIKQTEKELENKEKKCKEQEKLTAVSNAEIFSNEKIKKQISSLDICPLCKNKITQEHIRQVYKECDEKIINLQNQIKNFDIKKLTEEIERLKENLISTRDKTGKAEIDLVKLGNVEDKKEHIKKLLKEKEILKSAITDLGKEKKNLELNLEKFKDIEEIYDKIFLELQEISSRTQENLDSELQYRELALERARILIKQTHREEQELKEELEEIEQLIQKKTSELEGKEQEEKALEKRYQKLLDKKLSIEKEIHNQNSEIYNIRNSLALVENEINNLKIELARTNAEKENLENDLLPYKGIETINLPVIALDEKLKEAQIALQNLGSINLRALEVYDDMKKEYDSIGEKVSILENEKLEILKIIEEIDKKKKKTFMKTLQAINELFNRNFSQLSVKGSAFLEPENQEDIFSGGLDIIIKVAKGKYFDVTSLSGGEQTLVALSLIFAIQEYKPYSFYIFDEVDAALDKRNSERLAVLIKKYMKTGQYVIITHNDAIITESPILYGVSMQEGISKILSLEI